MSPMMSLNDRQSSVRSLDQRAPHLQWTDCVHAAFSRGDTSADTAMPPLMPPMSPVMPVAMSSDGELDVDELHLPAIPSAAAESRGSSFVAGESAMTTARTSVSRSKFCPMSVHNPSCPFTADATMTSTCSSVPCANCGRMPSSIAVADSVVSGVGHGDSGRSRSKELELPVTSLNDIHCMTPRARAQMRDERRQSGFRGDDERVVRSRQTRFNRTASTENPSNISGAFVDIGDETRYSVNVTASPAYRDRSTVSRKNRLSGQSHNVAVRPRQSTSIQLPLVKAASRTTPVRVVRSMNTQRTDVRRERPAGDRTSVTVDDDDVTGEDQRRRIIDWLDNVSEQVERPPSPHIDDSPTPTQTDTAIHIVYDSD